MLCLLARGRWLGLPWNLSDTVLTTYLLESMLGDAMTLLTLRRDAWSGRWRITWASLALEVFPSTLSELRARMRRLGVTQLSISLVVGGLSTIWFLSGTRLWWSHAGMVMLTSLFVLVTSLLPALPRIAAAGSAIDRLLAPRWAEANWIWAGVLRGLDQGLPLSSLVSTEQLLPLLPPKERPLEPVSLLFQTLCCEQGDFVQARPLVERWQSAHAELPAWLTVDGLKQAAAVYALVDGDLARATQCLDEVKRLQLVPWYAELVVACVAHARGNAGERDHALRVWSTAVEAHPRRGLLLGANRWILSRLEVT